MQPLPLALGLSTLMTAGVSPEAQSIERELTTSRAMTASCFAFRSLAEQLDEEFHELWKECHEPDWDGYGAAGLDLLAIRRAWSFLVACPPDLPLPELSAMPNGDVAMDWDFAPRRTITVTIGRSPRLVYAAIEGDEEWSGSVSYVHEAPASILGTVRRLAR